MECHDKDSVFYKFTERWHDNWEDASTFDSSLKAQFNVPLLSYSLDLETN